jgi:hypothetical protein
MASLAVALEPVSAESLAPNGFEFTGDGGEAAGVRCNDGLGTLASVVVIATAVSRFLGRRCLHEPRLGWDPSPPS